MLEGVGCWSPLFPARYDDIMLAASVVVKELTRMRRTQPEQPTLGVFEQVSTEGGFESFKQVVNPPQPNEDAENR